MNNVAPLQGMAENLAQHGRYGDSMLVHMNPIEVQGIASLSPTGRLTTNPVTGQQEAFLPFLAPLLGGALGLGATGSALLSGALTTIASGGDFKKGILSGLTSFGLGKIMDKIPSVGEGVDPSALTGESPAVNFGEMLTDTGAARNMNLFDSAGSPVDISSRIELAPDLLLDPKLDKIIGLNLPTNAGAATADLIEPLAPGLASPRFEFDPNLFSNLDLDIGSANIASNVVPDEPQGLFGRGLFRDGKPDYSRIGELDFKEDIFPGALMSGLGYSTQLEMDRQDALRRQAEELDAEGKSDLERTEGEAQRAIQQRIYDYGLPSRGILPRDPRFAPQGLAGGGLVSLNPSDYQDKRDGLARLMGEPVRMQIGGALPSLGEYQGYFIQPNSSETQSAIRGTQAISAPQMQALTASGYRAGFDPELEYFRTPDRFGNDPFPEVFDPRNPNAPVLPTDAQLAQELAEAEASGAGAGTADSAALYDMPGYASSDGTYSQFLGGTLGSGIAGVPTMGQNFLSDIPVLSSDNTLQYPSSSNEGIAALQGLDYSDYPKRSDFGPSDEGGHIEYQQAQQEWFRNRMPSARIDQPVMPSEATSPVVSTPPPPVDIGFDRVDDIGVGKVSDPNKPKPILTSGVDRGPILTVGDFGPRSTGSSVITPPMPPPATQLPPVMQPPVEQPPVSNEKLQRILADRPRRGDYDSPYDFMADLRDFRGINPFNKGGLVKMQDMGQVPEMPIDPALEDPAMMQADPMQEGIASVDPVMEDPMANIDPETQQLLEQTAMAILGQIPPEEADAIIQAFIEQFGPEIFQQFRDQVLTSVVPNAQTEGMVEGQGDGMSDEIMGMIGDQQQVAVSPGEYIVPADVVSGIGNGSSDAGAGELDRMLADIRQARTGMTEQPPEIDPRGAMPA